MRIKYFWRTCCFSVSVSLKLSVCVCEHVQSHCLILARWFSEILQGCILAGSVTIYLILQGSKDTTTTVVLCLKIVSPVSKTCLIFFMWLLELPYCLKCVLKLYEMCT